MCAKRAHHGFVDCTISSDTRNCTLESETTCAISVVANLHVVMPLRDTTRVLVDVLDVAQALVAMMKVGAQTERLWMESSMRTKEVVRTKDAAVASQVGSERTLRLLMIRSAMFIVSTLAHTLQLTIKFSRAALMREVWAVWVLPR